MVRGCLVVIDDPVLHGNERRVLKKVLVSLTGGSEDLRSLFEVARKWSMMHAGENLVET